MTDDELFVPPRRPTPRRPQAPKCRHHVRLNGTCVGCGHVTDPVKARRGRNNRTRGNAIEREIGKRLALRRVGQFGGPEDLMNDLFSAQVKSGGAFPERLWGWLKQVPVKAGQTALLVVADAPGPGRRRRGVVVIDIDDWQALHGRDDDLAIQPVDPYLEAQR
jgi:hypothetical protein